MLDLVIIDGRARGIVTRNLLSGEIESHFGHAVILGTGGYGNVYFLSTNAMGSNGSAVWKAYKKGAAFSNPAFVQIHPTAIPQHGDYQSKLTLMSESLRNDGRIWVPKKIEDAEAIRNGSKKVIDIADDDRDFYLERRYPAFGNLVPRDVASRAAKERCDKGYGIENNDLKEGVFLDFKYAIERLGKKVIEERYGNLFQMYEKITGDNPYETPMKIYPAIHYTMGGLWVDYELQSTIQGLFIAGEANFSDHGANRLGASALMQGLADGYFILPYTIQNYLADQFNVAKIPTTNEDFKKVETEVKERINKLLNIKGKRSVDSFHKELGKIMWNKVGMAREEKFLKEAIEEIKKLKKEFWSDVKVPGTDKTINVELEKALRVADFIELGELLARDALNRQESCGGHFRVEYQMEDGEALRRDDEFNYVATWEFNGEDAEPILHKEPLIYEETKVLVRNYKS
jgi:succinate dehydrogenase / fumarate reductase flavoprotein subunit